jgi:hypothetical protein
MAEYDPNTDYIAPPLPPAEYMQVINTKWGPMERWRAQAMSIGEISAAVHRDDSVRDLIEQETKTGPVPPEMRKAPPLVADAAPEPDSEPEPDEDEQDLAAMLSLVSAACDAISARLDRLKADRARSDAVLEMYSDNPSIQ